MQYAQLNQDGTYSHQITTSGNVVWGPDHTCPAASLTEEEAVFFNVVPLLETDPPVINVLTQNFIRDGSELVEGTWQYKWRVDELTPEQQEEKRKSLVPVEVTMRQARLALLAAGLLDDVEGAISLAGPAAKIEWEYAQEVQRDSGLVPAMAVALGMTDLQLDELFTLAATL